MASNKQNKTIKKTKKKKKKKKESSTIIINVTWLRFSVMMKIVSFHCSLFMRGPQRTAGTCCFGPWGAHMTGRCPSSASGPPDPACWVPGSKDGDPGQALTIRQGLRCPRGRTPDNLKAKREAGIQSECLILPLVFLLQRRKQKDRGGTPFMKYTSMMYHTRIQLNLLAWMIKGVTGSEWGQFEDGGIQYRGDLQLDWNIACESNRCVWCIHTHVPWRLSRVKGRRASLRELRMLWSPADVTDGFPDKFRLTRVVHDGRHLEVRKVKTDKLMTANQTTLTSNHRVKNSSWLCINVEYMKWF